MKSNLLTKFFIAGILVLTLILATSILPLPTHTTTPGKTMQLTVPEFIHPVEASSASGIPSEVATMLDQEAGISAYATSTLPVNISGLRQPGVPFKTIETLPSVTDYIIGSVGIDGFAEHFDVHVFVHKDGYFLAYYHRPDPISKIFDIKAWSIGKNHLDTAIGKVAGVAGAPTGSVNYYDFRNPSATSLLIIGEDKDNGNSFSITLPAYTFFERSWQSWYRNNGIRLDTTPDPNMVYDEGFWGIKYGTITQAQLSLGIPHTFTLECEYAILVLEYSVPK